ncbi:MAG TPA: DUF4198 domain-containing protein [Hyphomonadaceae bacterium]|nr:DUF4198 domain-containing protein [Hyphomonadaceae bacterium]HPI48550.1 DUF4198 domain-containing protein [Hyphomonadaceae bacterium]
MIRPAAKWGCATAALVLAIAAGVPAGADTSYLKPNFFTTANADIVTVQSSFTEDFPNPSVAVKSDAWTVIGPDGQITKFDTVQPFTQVTILEAATKAQGTYRLSTGERLGRSGAQVLVDGVWQPFAPGREIPAGAQTRQSQTATVADVYVTRGAPTKAPVEASVGALALKPVTHPNDVYLDTGFEFRVLLNGKPVANQQVEVWREGGAYEEPAYRKLLTSAADGTIKAAFDKPGVYLIWTRLSADAPAGAATPVRSYTTSLTLEVQP